MCAEALPSTDTQKQFCDERAAPICGGEKRYYTSIWSQGLRKSGQIVSDRTFEPGT